MAVSKRPGTSWQHQHLAAAAGSTHGPGMMPTPCTSYAQDAQGAQGKKAQSSLLGEGPWGHDRHRGPLTGGARLHLRGRLRGVSK